MDAKLRVLVAEDEPDVAFLVASLLDQDGRFDVVGEAGDGVETVRMAETLHPDAIVLDLFMPKMDGMCALREIRDAPRPCVVVVLTAIPMSHVESNTWLSADACLRKTELQSLPTVVASLCRETSGGPPS